MSREYMNGRAAHKLGAPVTANPYNATTQAWSSADWVKGWNELAAASAVSAVHASGKFAQELPS